MPSASISGTTEVCLNDPSPFITFTGTGSTAPYTFSYTINAVAQPPIVSNAAGIATIAVPTNIANTFTYNLTTVQDASSTLCITVITGQQAIVTVHPLPTANFNYSTPSCETRIINFTDASIPNVGTLTGWAWNFGDPASGGNNTSALQNPSHTFANSGTYTVELIVTSSEGCSNLSFTRTVVINDRPLAGFIIPEVCLSDTYAQFTDTSRIASGIINAWNWNFGDPGSGPNNTSTLQNPQHSYTAVGTYNVQLIVTSNNGCRDTIVQQLTVNGSFPVANFTVNNPTTLCANDSVAIVEASTVFPGVITRIEIYWDNVNFPAVFEVDDLPFTGKVYTHLYPNFQAPLTRVFTIRYRAYSGGVCVNDRIANITVNAAPLVQFNAMPDTCFLATPFQVTQASEIGGVPGTGVFTGPGISPTGIFSPAIAGIGTHTIMYTFTSAVGGCVDTMSNTITVLDTATAAFTYVSPICELVPASFTDVSTAPATVTLSNTVWNFGDGTPIENHPAGSTFTHMFPAPGTYTVTMYNVSAYGCNSTVTSQQVTVDANHIITLNAGSNDNQTVCINTAIAPILYTLSGGATGATVTGLPPGVTAQVTGNTLTISGTPSSTAASPYTYSVLTTGNTCVIADTTGVITVEPDHTITLTSAASTTDQSVCVNSAINNITYNLGGGASGVTITRLPPGVIYSVTGNTLTISGTPNSTAGGPAFAYSIITTGNTCITATAAGTIDVNPYPVPNFAVDKPSYCIPNAIVSFINGSAMPDGSGMTYLWNFDEPLSPNNTSTSVNPSHWYSGTGPFDVTLTVSSLAILNGGAVGCTHDTIIQVNTIHPQPKADFTYNKPSVCIGDNVTITDNTDGKDGIVNQWHWDMGDGAIRTTNPVTYTYFDTITYNITMYSINSHGCNSDTITKTFTVYPYPHVNAGPDRFVLEGGSIQLETITFANDAQYNWTPNLYLSDNHVARPRVIDPKTDMTYRLTVTGRGGCTTSDDVFVKLLKFPVIPNTFTPNGDAINDTWRIDFLNTYPNNRVQVFTRTGKLVFESRGYNTPWDGTIKGKPLPFDTYYYIIEPGNGRDPITGYVTIIK
ncbi:MAG: PKD domain-containing protein [Chitinophagaceae bacterium]|nr:PKD domain-containing protein [Chitinophagaceae bacterium]